MSISSDFLLNPDVAYKQACSVSLNHTQLALLLFSQLSAAVVHHKTNDDVGLL